VNHAIPGPDNITRAVLGNGMVVLVRENHSAPVAVLQGSLAAGALHETPAQAGLASFVASMLARGCQHYDFAAFNETVEGVGGNLTFSADTHSTDFNLSCLSEDFPTLVALLADALRAPTFPEEHVARLRQQKLVFLQERDQDTANVANLRFFETLFGREHPYGWAMGGYEETVAALGRGDLAHFHAQRYVPDGAVVVVAGDVNAHAMIELLTQHFGDWHGPAPERTTPPFPPAPGRARRGPPRPGASTRGNQSTLPTDMALDARPDDFEAGLRPLWWRTQSGDEAAYRAALALMSIRLRAHFRRRLQSLPGDLEDLVQETLLALHLQRGTFDPALPVSAWVHAVARHQLVDLWRRRGRHGALREPLDEVDEHPLASQDREEGGTRRDLGKLLQPLPEAPRQAIAPTKRDGPSVAEAAQRTGTSVSAIKLQVHRGLKRLAALVTVSP
jgi:RNA polymerase sigma factor (sigma-70 family)